MAIGNWTVYGNAKLQISEKAINLLTDTFVMILCTSSYTPVANTDAAYSAMSANELPTALGYTVGGVVLGTVTDVLSAGTVTWGAASSTWSAFSGTFKYAVIVHRAGGSLVAGDIPVCYFDVNSGGGSVTGGGGTLTISDASGILTIA